MFDADSGRITGPVTVVIEDCVITAVNPDARSAASLVRPCRKR
jgi:hypothetical protein